MPQTTFTYNNFIINNKHIVKLSRKLQFIDLEKIGQTNQINSYINVLIECLYISYRAQLYQLN